MNPIALVHAECANYKPAEGCLLRPKGCLVEKKNRCSYFEKAVLPLSRTMPDKYGGFLEAYLTLHPLANFDRDTIKPPRLCPDCGTTLPPRRRVCQDCAKKRQRQAYKNRRDAKTPYAQH